MDNDMSKANKIMAGAGIAGTIVYAIADMFLYIRWILHSGTDICCVCKNHGRVGCYGFAGESS